MIDWWVQGMRAPGDRDHRQSWQAVVYHRLTNQHGHILPGERTLAAERGLGLQESAYFYLGRCDPAYSEYAVVFSRPENPALRVAPFDTGGLWWSYVVTTVSLNGEGKAAMVSKYSMDCAAAVPLFAQWVERNYAAPHQYNLGEPPTAPYADEIDLAANRAGERAWTWEARVPVARACDTEAARLFLRDQEYGQYTQWVLANDGLDQAAKLGHVRMLKSVVVKCGTKSPGAVVNDWMGEEMQWTTSCAS